MAATYGVRASLFLSCFFYFSDKNGTYKLSLSGHSWKKGTFRNQWQSLINSPLSTLRGSDETGGSDVGTGCENVKVSLDICKAF